MIRFITNTALHRDNSHEQLVGWIYLLIRHFGFGFLPSHKHPVISKFQVGNICTAKFCDKFACLLIKSIEEDKYKL